MIFFLKDNNRHNFTEAFSETMQVKYPEVAPVLRLQYSATVSLPVASGRGGWQMAALTGWAQGLAPLAQIKEPAPFLISYVIYAAGLPKVGFST